MNKIVEYTPVDITILSQGDIVATSLADYLHRHPEMEAQLIKKGKRIFYTTDSTEDFDMHANNFFGQAVQSSHIDLG